MFRTCFGIIIVGRTFFWTAILSLLTSIISKVFIKIMSSPKRTGKLFVRFISQCFLTGNLTYSFLFIR